MPLSPRRPFDRLRQLLCILTVVACSIAAGESAADTAKLPIVIAIVDDAWVPDLDVFQGMLWQNPGEIANNGKDDDGNGRIDDLLGWDVSDQNENIRPPEARLAEYPHGTYMAAQIAHLIRQNLGDMDDYPIKLLFIKAISDTATYLHVQDGYQGLQAVLEYSPDVINLSWSGGMVDGAASKALAAARADGVFVVGSVGTYPQKAATYPASHPAVFGVAGIDAHNKLFMSNSGDEVEIAASSAGYPERLLGADSPEDISGVSNATALVTATVALMKHAAPAASNRQIKHCLQATAMPLDEFNIDLAGQLGAGGLDVQAAIQCIKSGLDQQFKVVTNPKGSLVYSHTRASKQKLREWVIAPVGMYAGLTLKPFVEGRPKQSMLTVSTHDPEADGTIDSEIIWRGLLSELPAQIATRHTAIKLELEIKSNKKFQFQARFATQNVDQETRFCSGQTEFIIDEKSPPIVLSDGSGSENYALNSDCKWLLRPGPEHDLALEFLELETELHVDSIYLFRGETTAQAGLLMKISGKELPPKIVVEGGPALLWFTSNAEQQREGFKLQVSAEPREQSSD